jgi:serine/threonine-protein kinase
MAATTVLDWNTHNECTGATFMPDLPSLTTEDVASLIPQASDVQQAGRGGQKLVFRGTVEGKQYALKFSKLPDNAGDDIEDFPTSDVAMRAKREVETMRNCQSSHMVKLGPIGLAFAERGGQRLLYFSEEFVVGRDLRTILQQDGRFPPSEVLKLGLHVADAIRSLWELGKIHRDIKPANIMRRDNSGEYVLLDAGLAFDIVGESISVGPVGTPAYFSPEQFQFTNRRTVLDFRSDIFSLGVTMYQMATERHPFWTRGDTTQTLYSRITTFSPSPPSEIVAGFPPGIDAIILRMLGKSPHLRYRKCDQLINALSWV